MPTLAMRRNARPGLHGRRPPPATVRARSRKPRQTPTEKFIFLGKPDSLSGLLTRPADTSYKSGTGRRIASLPVFRPDPRSLPPHGEVLEAAATLFARTGTMSVWSTI